MNNLPSSPTILFGRERYLSSTTAYIKNSVASTVVNIYGPPGIGKSELAIHIGRHMLQEGSCVYYIDLNKTDSIFSLNDKVERSSYLCEPEQIQLLILDNADHYWSNEKLMSVLSKYVNKLNILITSRKQVTLTHEVNNYSIPLNKLTVNDCTSLVVSELASLHKHANQICLQFNNIPQAVLLAIGPIKHTGNQIQAISQKLLSDYQNQRLNLFMPLDQSINGSASFIAAAFLWNVKNLVSDCHWYLVQFVDGSSLDKLVQGKKWEYCIKEFIGQSLLLIDEAKKYHFKPYTKELVSLLSLNESQIIQVKTHPGTVEFWERFSAHYMYTLVHLLEDTDDLELAIKIGSNQNITNSLLPLLSQSFDVTPLLYSASRIIEIQCSNPFFHTMLDASDMIYAIGHLHRALYCPAVNTIRLLRDPNYKNGSACAQCLEKINLCLRLVNTLYEEAAGNTAAMEARAFYYRLFGTNAKICKHQSWDYSEHLIDLANIVSFAKRKYESEPRSQFQNSKVITDIEVGLETYSLMRIAETKRLMQSVLKQTFENDQCNFAIKVIAIMVLHTLHLSEQSEEDFNDVSLHKQFVLTIDTANATCFASAYRELFIPFLKSVGQNTTKFEQSLEELEHFFDKTCHAQNLWVGHCYRRRYELSHGTFLFTADELTAEVSGVFSHLQEPLLCSLLRDIALDCPSPFPSTESVTSARETRTKRLIEDLKPLFPDPNTFVQVINSFQQKPVAYQYYSL